MGLGCRGDAQWVKDVQEAGKRLKAKRKQLKKEAAKKKEEAANAKKKEALKAKKLAGMLGGRPPIDPGTDRGRHGDLERVEVDDLNSGEGHRTDSWLGSAACLDAAG